ncbi:MAG: 5-formyltetrahydrofolate cyclo-ligase [Victivallaceae bacterium]|nr:5-formyltetrahydrofolate cyclo-ligase [Victivallaceae bacterium]
MIREAKKQLRKQHLEKRASLEAAARAAADAAINAALGTLPEVRAAERIAAYISDGTEVNLAALLEECRKAGKQVFLPRHAAFSDAGYEMVEINDLSRDLVPGKYGLMEPAPELPAAAAGQLNDLLWLVPGVAFDPAGARLGRGRGVYDRLLGNSGGLAIGVFYDCQRADRIPAAEHDRKLDLIVTETTIIKLKKSTEGEL